MKENTKKENKLNAEVQWQKVVSVMSSVGSRKHSAKSKKRKFFITALCAVMLSVFSTSAVVTLLWYCNPPPVQEASAFPEGFVLRDFRGGIIRVGLGEGDIDCRPVYKPSRDDWIVKAIIAAEDGQFYEHNGVRISSVLRAVRQNVSSLRTVSGASTITMQTVRLIQPHSRSFLNKIFEAFKALRLERVMTKDDILAQYLNRAPFGSNLVGIEAASQVWFGRRPEDLSLAEASLLAGLPQAPSRFRPDRNLGSALKRRDYVLSRMEELGMITNDERKGAESVPISPLPNRRPFRYPWFCDWVCAHDDIKHGEIRTTLSPEIQAIADEVLSGFDSPYETYAAVVLSVKDSSVVAMTATGDYFAHGDGQVNAAAMPRLAGSTLKPFAYASLADRGGLTPKMVFADVPRSFRNYHPNNFNGQFLGFTTADQSLVLSLNIPALEITERVGVNHFIEILRSLGFNTINSGADDLGLGIILGSVSVRLVDLAAAYGTLARGGIYLPPRAVADSDTSTGMRIFSEGSSWMISDILSGEERSLSALGHQADVKVPRFAWKTGTSSGFRDAWTVAWNPEYVVAVWCGNKRGRGMGKNVTGISSAAPIVWKIIRSLYPSGDSPWFEMPSNIKNRKVCSASGMAASPLCPDVVDDIYVDGVSLWTPCPVHVRDANGIVVEKWPDYVSNGLKLLGRKNAEQDATLTITSPADGTRYTYLDGIDVAQTAVVKIAGVNPHDTIYWFVNNHFQRTSTGAAPLVLPLSIGTFTITASSSSGESDQITLIVE